MALFLGIDGGGSGCRAAVADDRGRILGFGASGPANVNTDPEGAAANILAATQAALTAAGHATHTGGLHAVLGLAGANVRAKARQLHALLPFASARITTDAITSARGALGLSDGIVAAMGTGSVFAVQRGGQIRQYGGRGFVLGDEGSGAVLGRALLAEALRAEDGFVPMSPLLAEILSGFDGAEGIISFASQAKPRDFAELVPRLAGDDPAALRLLAGACETVGSIIDRLQQDAPLPVVFLGGLGPLYQARLAHRWDMRAAVGSGLDGALQLALQGMEQD